MTSIKRFNVAALAVVLTLVSQLASAQPAADLGIDTDAMLTQAATDIGGYVGWGIAVAVAVIAIWKVKKYASKAG